jgi:hypothetical protein
MQHTTSMFLFAVFASIKLLCCSNVRQLTDGGTPYFSRYGPRLGIKMLQQSAAAAAGNY